MDPCIRMGIQEGIAIVSAYHQSAEFRPHILPPNPPQASVSQWDLGFRVVGWVSGETSRQALEDSNTMRLEVLRKYLLSAQKSIDSIQTLGS